MIDLVDVDLGDLNWCARKMSGSWYAYRRGDVALHRVVAGRAGMKIDGLEVDHRDGNTLDCRRHNLRPATTLQSRQNRRVHRNSRTGVKGVVLEPNGTSYRAELTANGRRHYLGLFGTKEAAAAAYDEAAGRLHGEFRR